MESQTIKKARYGSLPGNGCGSFITTVTVLSLVFNMEKWKDIPSIENYQASNYGNIRSKPHVVIRSNGWRFPVKSTVLKSADFRGYRRVAIIVKGKLSTFSVHRLVGLAWIDNPDNKETINHKNGVKSDNRVENIEWATRRENIDHAIKTGLFEKCHMVGSQIGNSILKEDQVAEIKAKFKPRIYTRRRLADEYGVSEATIKDILYGRSWNHVNANQ